MAVRVVKVSRFGDLGIVHLRRNPDPYASVTDNAGDDTLDLVAHALLECPVALLQLGCTCLPHAPGAAGKQLAGFVDD